MDDTNPQQRALAFVVKRLIAHEALRAAEPEMAPEMIDGQLAAFLQSPELDAEAKAALRDLFEDAKQLAKEELKVGL